MDENGCIQGIVLSTPPLISAGDPLGALFTMKGATTSRMQTNEDTMKGEL